MRFRFVLCFILMVSFFGGSSLTFASSFIGTSAMNYLKINKSVKADAIGNAMTAGSGIHTMDINPAGIALSSQLELNLYSTSYIENISFHNFVAVIPTDFGTMGVNLGYIDLGTQVETSHLDEVGASENYFSSSGYQIMGAVAQTIKPFAFGIACKYLSQTLESFTGSAIGMDFGLNYSFNPDLQFGAAINNITLKKLKFMSTEEKLAQTIRVGLMYDTALFEKPLTLSTDFIFPNDGDPYIGIGSEFLIAPILELRCGYTNYASLANWSIGLGLLLNDVTLDFTYKPYKDFGASYRFGVGVKL